MCEHHDDDASAPEVDSSSRLSRRLVLAGGLAVGAVGVLPNLAGVAHAALEPDDGADPGLGGGSTKDYSFLPPRPKSEKHIRPIMYPVLPDPAIGTSTYTDTYLAPRAGGRLHEGTDLMGPKMLKLLAVCDATIVELRHEAAGNSLYLVDDDGWYYAYLHINNDDPGTDNAANQFKYAFAPGMAIGKRVLKGEHVAYLGDSGNAESTGSHCHFEIRLPNAHWYNAAACDATYSLDQAEKPHLRAKVAAAAFKPLSGAGAFANQQAVDFLGKAPSTTWLQQAATDLEGAVIGLDAFIERMLGEQGHKAITQPLIRLYLGFFLRIPDYDGLDYWIRKVRAGTPIATAASQFAGGSEFQRAYGPLDNAGFLHQIYQNLFARNPDPSGADYWKRRLDGGMKRGAVMIEFCESDEYRTKTKHEMRVIAIYMAMLHRAPDPSGYSYWAKKDAASTTGLQALIKSIRTGTAYADRF